MSIQKYKTIQSEQGQAATEFIIASVFLLIPLFLIIPILGKYIDIKHATISQARFEAWEYTVWNGPNEYIKNDIKSSQSSGRRQYQDTRSKGMGYFFSDPTSATYGTSQASFQLNPLWVDHRGDSLFTSSSIISGAIAEKKTPDGLKGVLDVVLETINFVLKIFGDLLELVHVDGKFDAIYTKGYFTSNVDVKLRTLDDILPQYSLGKVNVSKKVSTLEMHAKAAVLTNGWNAGSTENATSESRGLVITALLKPVSDTINGVITGLNNLASDVPGLEIKAPSLPDFGYVEDDLIPYEYLEGNQKELRDKSGLYYYE
ncbi:hypothetical protein UWK_00249 [Desulfocapsa sulfexigens DSM 10523]|uniref:TadE-like protein n=1 Tax=Desulfocapsa sulfexigens (strain DSM 10523 / SB164P1) TaxID=1167006 RepID=M1NAF4_DESSD|nr:hypothetical protein [Desulfocapsa sulfexigens]AGF76834.1 hypothetical protein UWK_00249 [Desulfocapsa sulfexigens DSM 10523]